MKRAWWVFGGFGVLWLLMVVLFMRANKARQEAQPPIPPKFTGAYDLPRTVTVHTDRPLRSISPLVYGVNGDKGERVRATVLRSGGNRMTAYNWENNASNAGSDWCFQNDSLLSSSDTPGEALRALIDEAKKTEASIVLTVPMVDWVAADRDKPGGSPPSCLSDVRRDGPDYLTKRFRHNRFGKKGPLSLVPDRKDDSVYQDEFVAWAKKEASSPVLFSLDNEPDLWSHTHAEVHPAKLTYEELVDRTIRAAQTIKSVWPEAPVISLVSFGWHGITTLNDAPDRNGKGELFEYFLDRMRQAEGEAKRRLVDYVDVHYYPEARGGQRIVLEPADKNPSPVLIAARISAPRSLYDSTYVEDSWIARGALGNKPINLLPRLREKIAQHYPGTQLAITEWSFGGQDHFSGALAATEALGAFGREGVGLANMWWTENDPQWVEAAFAAFRNYDGNGAKFGEQALAVEDDPQVLSMFASRTKEQKLVVVLVYKAGEPGSVEIAFDKIEQMAQVRRFVFDEEHGPRLRTEASPEWSRSAQRMTVPLPRYSVTVLELSPYRQSG